MHSMFPQAAVLESARAPRRAPQRNSQQGMALVFALLSILMLSMLAASLMFVTSAESFASFNFKTQMQAASASTAGVQRAMDWFRTDYATWLDGPGIAATLPPPTGTGYTITVQPPTYGGKKIALGGDSANFPDDAIKTAFNNMRQAALTMGNATGNYQLTASLLSHDRFKALDALTEVVTERWMVSVTGTLPGAMGNRGALGDTVVQETATIERILIPTFKDAIRGRCLVEVKGGITTDSYYSSAGGYDTGGNKYTGGDAQSSVGSNALITATGTSGTINGNAYWEVKDPNCTGGGGEGIADDSIVKGTIMQAPGVQFPPILPAFTQIDGASTNDCGGNAPYYFGPNTPATHYHTCTLSGGKAQLYFCVPALAAPPNPQSFFFNSLKSTTADITVMHPNPVTNACDATGVACSLAAPCPPVKLYVNVGLDWTGKAGEGMVPQNPTMFSILYSGTNDAFFGGGSGYYGTIYAPKATLTLAGGAQIYGAVTANQVKDAGNVTVHYDLTLQSMAGWPTAFRVSNQTRNVF